MPPLGVGDSLPQVSRDTCSGTATIWPLRGYTRHWAGKRGDDAAFRSDIPAWLCHNRLAILLGCLLYAVQVALASELPSSSADAKGKDLRDGSASPAYDHKQYMDL